MFFLLTSENNLFGLNRLQAFSPFSATKSRTVVKYSDIARLVLLACIWVWKIYLGTARSSMSNVTKLDELQ